MEDTTTTGIDAYGYPRRTGYCLGLYGWLGHGVWIADADASGRPGGEYCTWERVHIHHQGGGTHHSPIPYGSRRLTGCSVCPITLVPSSAMLRAMLTRTPPAWVSPSAFCFGDPWEVEE